MTNDNDGFEITASIACTVPNVPNVPNVLDVLMAARRAAQLPPVSTPREPSSASCRLAQASLSICDAVQSPVGAMPKGVAYAGGIAESLSHQQWMVCFWLELRSIWPHVPEERVMRLAKGLLVMAGSVRPEYAAATVAIGLGGMSLH